MDTMHYCRVHFVVVITLSLVMPTCCQCMQPAGIVSYERDRLAILPIGTATARRQSKNLWYGQSLGCGIDDPLKHMNSTMAGEQAFLEQWKLLHDKLKRIFRKFGVHHPQELIYIDQICSCESLVFLNSLDRSDLEDFLLVCYDDVLNPDYTTIDKTITMYKHARQDLMSLGGQKIKDLVEFFANRMI